MLSTKKTILATSLCAALLLSACSTLKESLRVKDAQTEPSLRLTLVPTRSYQIGQNDTFMAKVTDKESRAILRREDTHSLKLFALDEQFENLQVITPTPQEPSGLYHFTFTPQSRAYRVFAAVKPVGNKTQYPYTDLGERIRNQFTREEQLTLNKNGRIYELVMDDPLTRYSTSKLNIIDKESGTVLPIYSIIGFYDDFRHVTSATPEGRISMVDVELSPQFSGYMKFFANVKGTKGDIPLTFTAKIADD